MADIDVSQLLSDPDLCDDFQIQRRTSYVDADGREQFTTYYEAAWGSVQPAQGFSLFYFPEMGRQQGTIEIWTQFPLQAGAQGQEGDTIVWNGSSYVVTHVDTYLNWSDFVHAIATLRDFTVQPAPLP